MKKHNPDLAILEGDIIPLKKVNKKWLRIEECVVRYGVSRMSILRWIEKIEKTQKREITVRVGRTRIIDTSKIDEFLDERRKTVNKNR